MIAGVMVIGSWHPWVERTFKQYKDWCQFVLICQNKRDARVTKLIRRYGFNSYFDGREWGIHQPRIKEDLLRNLSSLSKPDWVIFLDSDELFVKFPGELLSSENDVAFTSWMYEMWDSEDTYREDMTFETVRLFRFLPQYGFKFKNHPVHCGNVPEKIGQWATYSNSVIKHYGLLRKEDRLRKVERYEKYDSKGIYQPKWWYESLKAENPPLKKFNEEDLLKTLPPTLFKKRLKLSMTEIKKPRVWKFINPHGNLIILNESEDLKAEAHYRQYLKMQGFKYIGMEETIPTNPIEAPVAPAVEIVASVPLRCDICGYVAKKETGLKIHKGKNHK